MIFKKLKFDHVSAFIFCLVCLTLLCRAQPAEEKLADLDNEANVEIHNFLDLVSKARQDPLLIIEGQIKLKSEDLESNLLKLDEKISTELDLLSKRESSLSLNLSKSDRTELLEALSFQKKTLLETKKRIGSFKNLLNNLNQEIIPSWIDLFRSFSDVAGEQKAMEKMGAKITGYLNGLPEPWNSRSTPSADSNRSDDYVTGMGCTHEGFSQTNNSPRNYAVHLAALCDAIRSLPVASKYVSQDSPQRFSVSTSISIGKLFVSSFTTVTDESLTENRIIVQFPENLLKNKESALINDNQCEEFLSRKEWDEITDYLDKQGIDFKSVKYNTDDGTSEVTIKLKK